MALSKTERRAKIRMRVRKRIHGTAQKPRMAVFRSNKEIYVQVIDDVKGETLVSASSKNKDITVKAGTSKGEVAKLVGKLVAEKSKAAGITEVVFDRGGYLYHGRIKNLADAAREGGLKF
jgi:large subunit ribosomal protein L18